MNREKPDSGAQPFRLRRADLILIAAVLLAALAFFAFQRLTRTGGGEVTVRIDGETVMTLSLDRDTQVTLGEGDAYNILVISDGSARVTEASCPDGICISQGSIHYVGQTIVCLPNRTVIEVTAGEDLGIDGISS